MATLNPAANNPGNTANNSLFDETLGSLTNLSLKENNSHNLGSSNGRLYSTWGSPSQFGRGSQNDCGCPSPRNRILEAAKTREGSLELQRILKEGKFGLCQQIFEVILGSIFQVMTNEYAHHLFRKLLEVCDSIQLNMIFFKLASHERLFVDVALHKHGSTAVQALIKRLKRSGFGHIITNILSMRFFELMTSAQGQYVVEQCFKSFKPNENQVLYDALLNDIIELATSQYGCISLNTCLNCVGGINRSILLHRIAEHSDILSHDPWGHYVIQHVLTLHDDNISRAICIRLERHYLHLAETMGGSHVVENCLKSSEFGMRSVVETLLERESKLVYLASHQFGNYVVQTALKVTKKHNNTLYKSLVMVLKNRSSALSHDIIGRHVFNLIYQLEASNLGSLSPD